MQGAYIICGDVFHVIGPILLTYVYQHYGVKYVWQFLIATMVIILSLWLIFYNRMIPSSKRMQQIVDATEVDTEE
jgi:predicted ABC-type sugar transport system permease subunit